MIYPSDIISATDLRTKMQTIFKTLKRPKFIVNNNKPQAVLISLKTYENLLKNNERSTEVDFGNEGISPDELLEIHKKL